MERRQRWLETQLKRHDDSLSKIAKQLQILQDFISLNFEDSFRQYAMERERVERINQLTYGNISKDQSYQRQNEPYQSPISIPSHHHHPHHHSPLTQIPVSEHFPRHMHNASNNSESDYDDGDIMDPAPESDPSPKGGMNQLSILAVDLSRERHMQQRYHEQEPNSTVTDYNCASTPIYYSVPDGHCDDTPNSDPSMMDEGPTDLSTDKKHKHDTSSIGSCSPSPYHGKAQGSILGDILTSNMSARIKDEVKDEEEPSQCYVPYPRSRTASADSGSKDKEYNSQSLWGAGTMTAMVVGANGPPRPVSVCSIEDASNSEQMLHHPSKILNVVEDVVVSKAEKTKDFHNFLSSDTGSDMSDRCDSRIGKISGGSATSNYSSPGDYRLRANSNDENIFTSSNIPQRSPSTTTTSSSTTSGDHSTPTPTTTTKGSGRKGHGNSSNSNASKQCRYCGKTFQWLHSVKTHERLHTGIKPYACKICGARFTQNGNLKVHAKTCVEKHVESYRSRNVFICSVCTEMFSDSDALMDHQKSHDRMQWTIKEKTCQLCGEVFQKRSFLLEHEKVHVQDRSFLNSLGIEAEAEGSNSNHSNPNTN